MNAAGLDPSYRQGVHQPTAIDPGTPALQLHSDAWAALELARRLATELSGERTVASESLVLALLRTDAALRQRLEASGLKLQRLEAALAGSREPALIPDEPLALADVTDLVHLDRILDAAGNRAREALRVLEDYVRFVLDDAYLTGELKCLRHDLTAALALYAPQLLAARDTGGDVGTALATAAERIRDNLADVVGANAQRLQEALRSLEEFGKVRDPRLGEAIEQLRYRSYRLAQALVVGGEARRRLDGVQLYVLLSASSCTAALDWTITEAAAGGAQMIQLREKALNDRDLLEQARRARTATQQAGVLFIVNDRPDVARLVGADGVHLGQDDMPVRQARRILGPDTIIGVSTHTLPQVRQAVLEGASYIGVGPTFSSGTKPFGELTGLAFVREALAETKLPAFVLGGINSKTIEQAVAAGAQRIAVSEAIARAYEPRTAAAVLRAALKR